MDRIYRYRMTTTSGGNLSIRRPDGSVWISPARVDKGQLNRRDVVRVDREGTPHGLHPPSSEFPFHRAIYDTRPDIGAIIHAHPSALVAFSICRRIPDTSLFHQAHSVCGNTGMADYACPGTAALGEQIAKQFADGCDSVVMQNHGVVVGGKNLDDAFARFEAFEFAAETYIQATKIGVPQSLDPNQLSMAWGRRVALPKTEFDAADDDEREVRKQLCDFLRRGCRQRLLISTEGSFSARLGPPDAALDDFVVTPTQRDRESLRPSDLVRVREGHRGRGSRASRAVMAHRDIYRRHPDVRSIVFAHPVHATAFSVTDVDLDTRTIPESYVFLQNVRRVPYGVQYLDNAIDPANQPERPTHRIADYVSTRSPAAVLQNDGVVVVGQSVLDAFDRLEVLEATAEAIVQAKTIGDITPMNDQVIDELKRTFNL